MSWDCKICLFINAIYTVDIWFILLDSPCIFPLSTLFSREDGKRINHIKSSFYSYHFFWCASDVSIWMLHVRPPVEWSYELHYLYHICRVACHQLNPKSYFRLVYTALIVSLFVYVLDVNSEELKSSVNSQEKNKDLNQENKSSKLRTTSLNHTKLKARCVYMCNLYNTLICWSSQEAAKRKDMFNPN